MPLLFWGGNLMAREDFAKAADVFRRGVAGPVPDQDKPIFGYYLASALELGGRTDEALAAARAALGLNKNSPLLASHEGWILYHAKRNDQARAASKCLATQNLLKKVAQISPSRGSSDQ